MNEEKIYFVKLGYDLIVVPGKPPKVQVISDSKQVVYRGKLNTYERRKVVHKWLSFDTLFLDVNSTFAHNNKEADEIVEKKLRALWGNPFSADVPDWAES